MSEYRVDDDTVLFHVVDGDERTIATFKPTHLWAANHMADALNTETASLQAELATQALALEAQSATIGRLTIVANDFKLTIARQQAENERYKAALGEIASANRGHTLIADIIDIAQEALTDSASLESVETIAISGVIYFLARFLTKRNETMATFTLDGKKVVVFPKSWLMYKRAILASWDDMAKPSLSCIVKPDDSHGEMQYVLQSIEGVEPDALPHSEENESQEE